VLALAVGVGVATGLVEGLVMLARHAIFGQVIFASRHVWWMTPIAYGVIFATVGLALAAATLVVPALFRSHAATFFLVAFGVGCLLLPIGQLSRVAAAVLAIGVGVQAATFARRHPPRARRTLVWGIAGLAVVAAAGGLAVEARLRSDAFDGEFQVSGEGAPNVLIVVWDTVRAASLSLYGHTSPTTPNLEALAAESVVFDHAFSTSPWTLPGHATLFTGYYPHEMSGSWFERLDGRQLTLAEVFRRAGHATGGFVANHHYTSYDSGLARGFDTYRDYVVSLEQIMASSALTQTPSGWDLLRARSLGQALGALRMSNWTVEQKRGSDRKHSDEVNAEFLTWLDGLDGRPFFAFLNFFDAHEGYWSPPEFRDRFAETWEGAYEAAIAYQDDRLGLLLEELDRRGVLDNTLVVITSDHGEMFGEHGLNGHAKALYIPTLHVPLIIRYPAQLHAARVAQDVSLRDVPATILDLAGLQVAPGLPGESLRRTWAQEPLQAEDVTVMAEVQEGRNNPPEDPISRGAMRAVMSGGWQLILNGDGEEELFEYRGPQATVDVVDRPENSERRRSLRERLVGFGPIFDRSP